MTRWRLSSFDRTVLLILGGLVLFIFTVGWRGDRVGVDIVRTSPTEHAGQRSSVAIQFSEPMNRDSVATHFRLEPAVAGEVSWSGARMIFRPTEALQSGNDYTVVVGQGAQSEGGRELLQERRFSFRVSGARVAYLAPEDGQTKDVWLGDPTNPGSSEQLTHSAFGVEQFDVSPDGSRIVFSERVDGSSRTDLRLLDVSTREVRPLTSCGAFTCTNPAWSPDGSLIAYERLADNQVQPGVATNSIRVWLVDPNASSPTTRPLFTDPQTPPNGRPRWSPDGRYLAAAQMVLFPEPNPGLLVYRFADEKQWFFSTRFPTLASFSADSQRLVYPGFSTDGQTLRTTLQVVDLASDDARELAGLRDQAQDGPVEWQPDDRALIVTQRTAEGETTNGRQLYLLGLDGGALQPLIVDPGWDHASFRLDPQGRELLVQRSRVWSPGQPNDLDQRAEIWTYDLATRQLRQLATNAYLPHWVP